MRLLTKVMLMNATISTAAAAEDLQGHADPTLALNLSGVRDWRPGTQFLDQMRLARDWVGHPETGKEKTTSDELRAAGALDDEGWPTTIPDGVSHIQTALSWTDSNTEGDHRLHGVYVISYEGEGDLRVRGDATLLPSEEGVLRVSVEGGRRVTFEIHDTDPNGTGDYLRDISIVREEHVELHQAGAVFDPDWLAMIDDARELRFLNWMEANDSEISSWEDRPTPDGGPRKDISVEEMVHLANQVGADPWFTMPHLADEGYIRNFAEYVRDNLDPSLTAKVEYSNETWNWGFKQSKWLLAQSEEEWGVSAHRDYYVKKAVETAEIWNDVFGEAAEERLSHVLATHTGNGRVAETLLKAEKWRENEPDAWVDPATVFDELAVTTYFGGSTLRKTEMRDELLSVIKDPGADATAWLHEKLQDPDYSQSVPDIASKLAAHAALAHENGMLLTSYEGGQHLHHKGKTRDLSEADQALLMDFVIDFVRSPEMADLHRQSWESWAAVGDGPYMQFGDMTSPSKFGSWGIFESMDSVTERGEALLDLNASDEAWWDDEGGEHHMQGVHRQGTEAADALVGTAAEDYLLAGAGDDMIDAGAGDDGVHGGSGTDRAIFSGAASDYSVSAEGDGYRVEGPDGSDFLIDVEEIAFGDGTVMTVAEADGMVAVPPAGGGEGSGDGAAVVPGDDGADGGGRDDGIPDTQAGGIGDLGDQSTVIRSVNAHSETGKALGMPGSDIAAFTVAARGAKAEIDGGVVEMSYESLQNGAAFRGGPQLMDDTLAMARLFGDVVVSPGPIATGAGDDRFFGRGEDNTVSTGAGRDRLDGRGGDDLLDGGADDDVLIGGAGDDVLTGGGGSDRFVFHAGAGDDVVRDYAAEDRLDLRGFLKADQSFEDAISHVAGNTVLSNGVDTITFEGVGRGDLGWFLDEGPMI